jgi:hypothetical protein
MHGTELAAALLVGNRRMTMEPETLSPDFQLVTHSPDLCSDGASGQQPAGADAACALCQAALEPAPESEKSGPTRADDHLCSECLESVLHIYA